MAASSLPAPGTEYGPCEPSCEHTDCAATRAMAGRNCAGCAEKIGYEKRFFREDDGSLLHMACWTPPQFDPALNPALDNRGHFRPTGWEKA
jgi:hypothetical protein